ncbi:similar to Saccharomyces cerevisiae YMR319C FET4 Low-affinity Fe(II) transporter of the plasma membrane [Maudiozyma barnettii]|uniref:Similar to Saccharomyces cerevisiae YMR319C FET4 Low-affinity Fe(II) transporter of the plasma membrane n=1 Tax=Maudiozyma barnettii TaxID=61262 RepID=A0A8H2VAU2_9SACH|nr:Fet4p [Kazachstania barnettii]CAB4251862.1 similar to Saccharomyces cerevisiae YMR319C FET4 Low-affinity Fe(II) transporter of the plasma membrane [Kazachstania barnettii]CAD1778145.1 similar to Saccharomyces cerevisiae YMR319C FET4 Low-affinity Fe(II) transporter of the plasma membrane [Kazachstania barnettii]
MGSIKKFFGNPGDRPGVRFQASIPDQLVPTNVEILDDEKNNKKTNVDLVHDIPLTKNDDITESTTCSLSDGSTTVELSNFKIQSNKTFDVNKSFTGLHKGYMDLVLDKLVFFAGSIVAFFCVWVILIIWVIIGAIYNAPFNWQVVMQDGQSIQCYIWDTLLMRQQLCSSHEQLLVCCNLRSKLDTFKRMVKEIHEKNLVRHDYNECESIIMDTDITSLDPTNPTVEKLDSSCPCQDEDVIDPATLGQLPVENWYDRVSNYSSIIVGSLITMGIFWIAIAVWIGCGAIPQAGDTTPPFTGQYSGSNPKYKKFSDAWQMDINTAVAVSLLICTTFLQNIRARHDQFIAGVLVEIFEKDERIDIMLRTKLNDYSPHKIIVIPEAKRTWLQKVIDWYADVIGTGIGVIVAIIVFGVWIGIGTPMNWGDDWWLIIGTYTGLVGFIDGYVLREVYYRSVTIEETNYTEVIAEDLELMQILGISNPRDMINSLEEENARVTKTLNYRISAFVNKICSDQYSVVCGFLIVIALICISSGMKWSTTGQLIANTPTMIIEEFFLIVLIQAHNWADVQRRLEISTILAHRHIIEYHISKVLA